MRKLILGAVSSLSVLSAFADVWVDCHLTSAVPSSRRSGTKAEVASC